MRLCGFFVCLELLYFEDNAVITVGAGINQRFLGLMKVKSCKTVLSSRKSLLQAVHFLSYVHTHSVRVCVCA